MSTHKEELREWRRTRLPIKRRELRLDVLERYGGKCACCGEAREGFLAIDHIGGGGTKHRKEVTGGGGSKTYRWLQKNGYPRGFRVLCHNCNMAIGLWGKCPHETDRMVEDWT
jgi:hypothetical protein